MIEKRITLNDLPGALRVSAGAARRAAVIGLRMGARRGEALMAVKSAEIADTSLYMQGWTVDDLANGAVLMNDAPHAAIVEEGSRPHWPPLLPILEYLGRKVGVTLTGVYQSGRWDLSDQELFRENEQANELRLMAVALAQKIASHGTAPKRIMGNAQGDLRRYVREEVERALSEIERSGGGVQ